MTEGGIIIIILAAELRERPGGGALSYFPFLFIFFIFTNSCLKFLAITVTAVQKKKIMFVWT